MALVLSSDIDTVNVQVFGNWFTFKPGQVKAMDKRIVDFLSMEKRELGFVSLPEICEEEPDSEEAKRVKAEAVKQGRQNIMDGLQRLINNLEISLQKDYDIAGIKTSAVAQEGRRHLHIYQKMAKFKEFEVADSQSVVDEINKLKGNVNGSAVATDTKSSTN